MRVDRLLLAVALLALPFGQAAAETPRGAPEFTASEPEDWINSPPLTLAELRGKVVLIDVWTFGCWNCYRSFPWLNGVGERYAGQGLIVIGVHSPEFERERDRRTLVAKVKEFGLHHPVMIDNDLSYWQAINNRYWPAFYLVDRKGRIRHRFVGETHVGDRQAQAIERAIEELLAEPN
jgi:thiol-disulfide isomerase/thioredoxin